VPILLFAPPTPDRADILAALPAQSDLSLVVDTAAQASSRLAQGGIELVVLDLAAPDAIKFLRKLPSQRGRAPIVCIADRRRPDASSEALRLGVVDIVGRPVDAGYLSAAIDNAREMTSVARRPPAPVEVPDGREAVFAASPAMRDVVGIVRRVAHSRCGVLIVGEPGTGRETVARAIHAQGARHQQPFLKVLCGEATAFSLETTLTRAAQTAATVYLEDLSELPAELQARLESAGGSEARLVASADARLNDIVARGQVRRGLVEMLSVVRIDLPPLRQRADDIPILALHFLKDACARNGVAPKTFSRGALTLLQALPWRGNSAEMRSLMERLAVLVPRGVVLLEDVVASVRFEGAEAVGRNRGSLKDARERFEREYVTAMLEHHKGRMGAAAKEMGIERTNLYRKIKQLNIRWTIPE
jgi:DNA-binding NtrC family response regulator